MEDGKVGQYVDSRLMFEMFHVRFTCALSLFQHSQNIASPKFAQHSDKCNLIIQQGRFKSSGAQLPILRNTTFFWSVKHSAMEGIITLEFSTKGLSKPLR